MKLETRMEYQECHFVTFSSLTRPLPQLRLLQLVRESPKLSRVKKDVSSLLYVSGDK